MIIDTIVARDIKESLAQLAASEARVLLLYSTYEEAKEMMKEANKLDLTGANYIWIAAQAVIGNMLEESLAVSEHFPVGMLGKSSENASLLFYENLRFRSPFR